MCSIDLFRESRRCSAVLRSSKRNLRKRASRTRWAAMEEVCKGNLDSAKMKTTEEAAALAPTLLAKATEASEQQALKVKRIVDQEVLAKRL